MHILFGPATYIENCDTPSVMTMARSFYGCTVFYEAISRTIDYMVYVSAVFNQDPASWDMLGHVECHDDVHDVLL